MKKPHDKKQPTKAEAYTLITGASSGIGAALAEVFAREQHHLILVARNEAAMNVLADKLMDKHGISAIVIPMDLAVPRAARQLVQRLNQDKLNVDVLVNNAGFGQLGAFPLGDELIQLDLIAVNITCLTELTRLLLPSMIAKKSGYVLQVASIAGFVPGPMLAMYYASKAYVVSLSRALQSELAGSGVGLTVSCPGPTATNFGKVAGIHGDTSVLRKHRMTAEEVAKIAYRDLMAGKAVSIPGWRNKVIILLAHLLPASWMAGQLAKINAQLLKQG